MEEKNAWEIEDEERRKHAESIIKEAPKELTEAEKVANLAILKTGLKEKHPAITDDQINKFLEHNKDLQNYTSEQIQSYLGGYSLKGGVDMIQWLQENSISESFVTKFTALGDKGAMFVVVLVVSCIFLVISFFTVVTFFFGGVIAAVLSLRLNPNRVGFSKRTLVMRSFVYNWFYVIYGFVALQNTPKI